MTLPRCVLVQLGVQPEKVCERASVLGPEFQTDLLRTCGTQALGEVIATAECLEQPV